MTTNLDDDVLDVPGACKFLRMGKNTIYEACARGEMPHRKIGNRIRFSKAALLRWLGSCGGADARERQ